MSNDEPTSGQIYTIYNYTKTYKAIEQTRYALESLESQLFNAYLVWNAAIIVLVLFQIVYNL